jgi:hypothetical protein
MPIEKRQLDEKTFELYNTDRDNAVPPPDLPSPSEDQSAKFDRMEQELMLRQMVDESRGEQRAQATEQILEKPSKGRLREWRKQTKRFDRFLKKASNAEEIAQGVQEMLDSGAMWLGEGGDVFGSVPIHSEKGRQRMVDAAGTYTDYMNSKWGKGAWTTNTTPLQWQMMDDYYHSDAHLENERVKELKATMGY